MSAKTMITACFALVLLAVLGGLLYAAIAGDGNVAFWTVMVGGVILGSLIEARQDLDE